MYSGFTVNGISLRPLKNTDYTNLKTAPATFGERIGKLKEIYRGWINYFRMARLLD